VTMSDDRRRELVDATLAALAHTVGREEDLPRLREVVTHIAGPVTFAELAEALAGVDVSARAPGGRRNGPSSSTRSGGPRRPRKGQPQEARNVELGHA
jgi:hypothetical protein